MTNFVSKIRTCLKLDMVSCPPQSSRRMTSASELEVIMGDEDEPTRLGYTSFGEKKFGEPHRRTKR